MTWTIKYTVSIFIFLAFFTIGCSGENSNSDFPKGCVTKNYEFNGKNLVLTEDSSKQSLFLFNNISDTDFWLNHPVTKNPGASAGWASSLEPGNWSALNISGVLENFEITCATMNEDGKLNYLDCRNAIKTCRVKDPVFDSDSSGSYWVAEDKSLDELIKTIKSRGISWQN